jgi:hypothetical protein
VDFLYPRVGLYLEFELVYTELMPMSDPFSRKRHLQDRLGATKRDFLCLLDEISDADLERLFPGEKWTIKEELVHIVQVLEVIPGGIERASQGGKRSMLGFVPSGLRSWVNGTLIIPRKAKHETQATIIKAYADAHENLINQLEELGEDDWHKGMPYPRKYRTLAQLAYRPVEHFEDHQAHIRTLMGK